MADTGNVERRAVPLAVVKALGQDRTVGGYASIFNSESRLIPRGMGGGFVETVLPSFFNAARAAGWPGNQGSGVLCRYNHNDQYLLGTTAAGTLALSVDSRGLEYRAHVPSCRDDVLELISRGDIRNSSFTFGDAEDDWDYRGGVARRTLISGAVYDVAPVSAAAGYADTSVGLRSLSRHVDAPVEDVIELAAKDELRQLFTRSDRPQPTGVSMSYRNSQPNSRPTLTGHQAKLILMAKRIPPTTKAEIRQQESQVQQVRRMAGL